MAFSVYISTDFIDTDIWNSHDNKLSSSFICRSPTFSLLSIPISHHRCRPNFNQNHHDPLPISKTSSHLPSSVNVCLQLSRCTVFRHFRNLEHDCRSAWLWWWLNRIFCSVKSGKSNKVMQLYYFCFPQHWSTHFSISINLVLFWTPWFASNPLSLYSNGILPPDSSQFLKPPLCYQRYPNCYFTTHRKYLNNSKVILFHWWDLQPGDLPLNRMASQAWTLYDAEPPPNLAYLSQNYPQMTFNQTATYRTDSDVVVPYARLVPGSGGQTFFDFRLKTKNVVWFVSNCNSASRREIYVKQLAKYIDVDIYGKCGTSWNCGPKASSDCYQQAARQYRFYLSFENAICR